MSLYDNESDSYVHMSRDAAVALLADAEVGNVVDARQCDRRTARKAAEYLNRKSLIYKLLLPWRWFSPRQKETTDTMLEIMDSILQQSGKQFIKLVDHGLARFEFFDIFPELFPASPRAEATDALSALLETSDGDIHLSSSHAIQLRRLAATGRTYSTSLGHIQR